MLAIIWSSGAHKQDFHENANTALACVTRPILAIFAFFSGAWGANHLFSWTESIFVRTRSTTTRDRNLQFRGASPLEALHWIFCFFSSFYVQFSKTSPLKSGESSEKSSGENRVKSCHVCSCHVFFGPDFAIFVKTPCSWKGQGTPFAKDPVLGRTPKGAYSTMGRSRQLLETPFSEPLLRTLLGNPSLL